MNLRPAAFTLIEVMLAVAIFAFAVVGFGVALNDVLGVNSEILRTNQRRQAIESAMALILASANNFQPSQGFVDIPGEGPETSWTLQQQVGWVDPVPVPGPNNTTIPLDGWWQVELRAVDEQKQPVDRIGVLLYRVR